VIGSADLIRLSKPFIASWRFEWSGLFVAGAILKPKYPHEVEMLPLLEAPLRQKPFNLLQSHSIALAPAPLQSGKDRVRFNAIQSGAGEPK
jgi:hypothetical protein